MTLLLFFSILCVLISLVFIACSCGSDDAVGFVGCGFMLWLIFGSIGTLVVPSPTYPPDYIRIPVEQVVEHPDKSFSIFLANTKDPIHISSFKHDPLRKTKFVIQETGHRNAWGGGLTVNNLMIDETLECLGKGSVTINDTVITYE